MNLINKTLLFVLLGVLSIEAIKAQDFELDTTFNAIYNFYSSSGTYNPVVYNLLESANNELYVSGECYEFMDVFDRTLLRFDSLGNFDTSFHPNGYFDGFTNSLFALKFQDNFICSVGCELAFTNFFKYDTSGNIINNSWTQNFHNAFQTSDDVVDGYLYENGKIIFVGDFCLDTSYYNIVRINANGSPDTSLMVYSCMGTIWKIEPYGNDKLLVYGYWTSWLGDSTVEFGLRRINLPSCTIDAGFQNVIEVLADSGFGSRLNEIHVLEDRKIIITGRFKLKGIDKTQGIARLNSDGSLDTTFNNANNLASFYSDYSSQINTISLLHDSTGFLIGGFFESYQGYDRHSLVKTDLNGFIDPLSLNGLGVDTISDYTGSGPMDYSRGVTQILPTKNGKYYIAGQIDGFNGVSTQPVFRIQTAPYNSKEIIKKKKINLYPNPASNTIQLDINNGANLQSNIEIYNQTGKLVMQIPNVMHKMQSDSYRIDISKLTSGMYYLILINKEGVGVGKFVVMR